MTGKLGYIMWIAFLITFVSVSKPISTCVLTLEKNNIQDLFCEYESSNENVLSVAIPKGLEIKNAYSSANALININPFIERDILTLFSEIDYERYGNEILINMDSVDTTSVLIHFKYNIETENNYYTFLFPTQNDFINNFILIKPGFINLELKFPPLPNSQLKSSNEIIYRWNNIDSLLRIHFREKDFFLDSSYFFIIAAFLMMIIVSYIFKSKLFNLKSIKNDIVTFLDPEERKIFKYLLDKDGVSYIVSIYADIDLSKVRITHAIKSLKQKKLVEQIEEKGKKKLFISIH